MPPKPRRVPDECVPGFHIGRFELNRRIGRGGYGLIFVATDLETGRQVALKFEKEPYRGNGILQEIEMMQALRDSPHFPQFYDHGVDGPYRWLSMALMGPSISQMSERSVFRTLSSFTALYLGYHMLQCIEDLHNRGYIHGDVKPSNFLLQPCGSECPVCLIDFGLSFRYLDDSGSLIPPAEDPGFIGTAKYASLRVHAGHAPGRGDDLISLAYSIAEIAAGELPWWMSDDKDECYQIKKQSKLKKVFRDVPNDMIEFYERAAQLQFDETPDYAAFYALLDAAKAKVKPRKKLEWQGMSPSSMAKMSPIDINDGGTVFQTSSPVREHFTCNVQ